MVKLLSNQKIIGLLVGTLFILFSLGQLPSFLLEKYLFSGFSLHPLEAVILVFNLLIIALYRKLPGATGLKLIAILMFSYLLGGGLLGEVLVRPFLYLIRLINLVIFFYQFQLIIEKEGISKNRVRNFLNLSLLFILFSSLAQYVFLPDMRFMYMFGWDDHLGRLVGLFFDPNFTGLMLSLSALWFLEQNISVKNKLIVVTMFTFAVLATFSRSTYIVYFAVMFLYLIRFNLAKVITIAIPVLVLVALLLPRSLGGEGVNLLRTNSLYLRFENLIESTTILTKSPLFGFGPGQLCEVREQFLFYSDSLLTMKNSCSNFDFGPSNVVAIGGVSLLLFIFGVILKSQHIFHSKGIFPYLFLTYLLHGLLTTTWIYPWAIFLLVVAFSLKDSNAPRFVKKSS